MSKSLFSCVMPVKGARPYIDAALSSLKAQGMGDDLEIIVQDGDVEPDQGQSDALNKGFAKAKGEWLFWLNADDLLLPGALQRIVRMLECSECSDVWIAGNQVYINEMGKCIKHMRERGSRFFYRGLPVRVYGPSSFFKRELFEKVGGLDVSLKYMMDTDLWNKFRAAGYWYKKVPEYLWGFRVWKGSLTSADLRGEPPAEMELERLELERRYGIKFDGWRKRMLQLSRVLDGSYLRAYFDQLK